VVYFSLPKLLGKIKTDKIDDALRNEIERIKSKHLLILDDWGINTTINPSNSSIVTNIRRQA
jgi:DNA replication protein DnaC